MEQTPYITDYSYCSGVCCPIRKQCRRYLPDPLDISLWWVAPAYDTTAKCCPNHEPKLSNPANIGKD